MPGGFVLVTVQGQQPSRKFHVDKGVARIGREGVGNEIVIDEASVSRRHAIIVMEGGGYALQDLGSTNGTLHRGKALPPGNKVRLGDGDDIRIGEVALRFELDAGDPAPATAKDDPTRPWAPARRGGEERGPTSEPVIARTRSFPRKAIVAAGVVAALLVLVAVLVLMKRSRRVVVPDKSELPIELPASGPFGNCKPDRTHPDKAIFTFVAETTNAQLHYVVGGVEAAGEVAILVDGNKVAEAPTAAGGWSLEQTLQLPSELLIPGVLARVVFDNTSNPPGREDWGVRDVSVSFKDGSVCNEREAQHLYDLAKQLYEQKAVSEGNLYRAMSSCVAAAHQVIGCRGKLPLAAEIERTRASAAREVDEQYASLTFSYYQAMKLKDYERAAAKVDQIMRLIPDESDTRNMDAVKLKAQFGNGR